MKKSILKGVAALSAALFLLPSIEVKAAGYSEVGQYGRPFVLDYGDTDEQIEEEILLGEMEELSILVEAEAGNQSFEGKCRVVDVVLNRVESPDFPNTIHDVIFQPGQFSVINNGAYDRAAYNMQESDYSAVEVEIQLHENKEILYFNNCSTVGGTGTPFRVGGHWFNA